MGLTNNKEDQLRKMPLIETKILKSKDGKYVIHRTIITSIKPIAYYEKVLAEDSVEKNEDFVEENEQLALES